MFEEYRGRVGTVDFTDASKAYLFPIGVPGLFRQLVSGSGGLRRRGAADVAPTANTIGLPPHRPRQESV